MDDNGDGVATQTKNSYGKLRVMSLAYQVSEQLVQLDDGQAPVARSDRLDATTRHVREMLQQGQRA